MRLVCPNCAAQYEVDESVIPEMGRDVQCSSCGQMWFQPGKAAMIEAEAAAVAEPDGWDVPDAWETAAAPETQTAPTVDATTEAPPAEAPREAPSLAEESLAAAEAGAPEEPIADPTPEPAPDPAEDSTSRSVSALISAFRAEQEPDADAQIEDLEETAPLGAAPQPGAQPRRALDDSLLSILREEAEREARARRAEGSSIETQEELNLDPTEGPRAAPAAVAPAARAPAAEPSPAPARGARPPQGPVRPEPAFEGVFAAELMPDAAEAERVADLEARAEPVVAHSVGRERLPDIEEINSTLRAASERSLGRGTVIRPDADERRSGFRLGFSSVILAALIALGIYSFAGQIAESLPAAAPMLDSYVALVDQGRIWLDGQLQRAIDSMQAAQQN